MPPLRGSTRPCAAPARSAHPVPRRHDRLVLGRSGADALADLHSMDTLKKEVLYDKGLIHGEMGDKPAALDCFKQIYEVDYGYRDVAKRVESSYS